MSAAGITYSRHVQLSLGSSQQTGSPIGDVLHCIYRDVYGPVLSEIDVGVFVRAHLHRSQGPHILPSRATGIPSLPVGSSRPLIGQSVRSSCPYRCHFGTNIHLVDHLSIRCIHWSIRLSIFYRKASWQRPCITHWTGSSTCRRIVPRVHGSLRPKGSTSYSGCPSSGRLGIFRTPLVRRHLPPSMGLA